MLRSCGRKVVTLRTTGGAAYHACLLVRRNTNSTCNTNTNTNTNTIATVSRGMACRARAKSEEAGEEVEVEDAQVRKEEEASFEKHQSKAERLTFAQEGRTLLDIGTFGVISTMSARGKSRGFPNGSIVGYAAREDTGLPIFAFSTLSSHTHDIDADPRFSLTVTAPGFRGASDARVTITGTAYKVTDEEKKTDLKRHYKAKHPNAFWVDFGDFAMYEATELVGVRLVGGFARAGSIKAEEFMNAEVDDIVQYSEAICGHMNDDHNEQIPLVSLIAAENALKQRG